MGGKGTRLLFLAWTVSIVATLGSLFFSEVMKFVPCTLCWFQRVFMYPQTVLLGIAIYSGERQIAKYTLTLSAIGLGFSTYHILLQNLPHVFHDTCTVGVPCSAKYINLFGFISIPVLAFVAFLLIAILSVAIMKDRKYIDH